MAGEAAGLGCQWRLDILRELRQRNKRESGGFSELIASRTYCIYDFSIVMLFLVCVFRRREATGAAERRAEGDHEIGIPEQRVGPGRGLLDSGSVT